MRSKQRLQMVLAQLDGRNTTESRGNGRVKVKIGDVELFVFQDALPTHVPSNYLPFFTDAQDILAHLRWIAQKDILSQDMFLIGPPGPLKRQLVLHYAQLTQREIEYVAISRDCTDADLKQRREIRDGTAVYIDQPCVTAAIEGRLLILDGIEKAERNVLPILNNLLENREMALEDGRFLVHPKRYDQLISGEMKSKVEASKLVRTSEKFLIVALGLPVPQYDGMPLDPPFRSRFQARHIGYPSFKSYVSHIKRLFPSVPEAVLKNVLSVGFVLKDLRLLESKPVPELPISLDHFFGVLNRFPLLDTKHIMHFCLPDMELKQLDDSALKLLFEVLGRFSFGDKSNTDSSEASYQFLKLDDLRSEMDECLNFHTNERNAIFKSPPGSLTSVAVPCGPNASSIPPFFVKLSYHHELLAQMIMAHTTSDICIIGAKGVGKSAILRLFAKELGYDLEYIPLHKDMTSRDLLQRRNTTSSGDTIWENSGLVQAALYGRIAVLDPIDVLSFGKLASIQRLIFDREMNLPDGKRLINSKRYRALITKHGYTKDALSKENIYPIHPSFRIIAVARPKSAATPKGTWLTPEIAAMFLFVFVRPLDSTEEMSVLTSLFSRVHSASLLKLTMLANRMRSDKDETIQSLGSCLSTRQLLRIGRRLSLFPNENVRSIIFKASLYRFLPSMEKDAFSKYLDDSNIPPLDKVNDSGQGLTCEIIPGEGQNPPVLRIGDVQHPIEQNRNALLIPSTVFFENTKQTKVLQDILKDYTLGEHLLLVGNQGVGKNKLVDHLLEMLQLPREYIQLHRDVTVHSLTSNPTVDNGLLKYEDSPLVRAVREGSILVVDEADKAPTHVTAVLKTLIEDGEMVLSDGRRIVADGPVNETTILIHPKFRMFVLANRPGYPFLGNDFWREIGDVFACHCIDNPDPASELKLLKNYAPNVGDDVLMTLVSLFDDLHRLVDEGLLTYPFSTRELVNVAKHLDRFPTEGISRALQNVFDFDQHEPEVKKIIIETLNKNGVPTGMESTFKIVLADILGLPESVILEKWVIEDSPLTNIAVQSKSYELNARGVWRLGLNPTKAEPLARTEGRAVTFSELLYSFSVPAKADVQDILQISDGSLFVISTNPSTLTIISPDHRSFQNIDMYEYIPSTRGTKLSLAEIGAGIICIHNSVENNLIIINFTINEVSISNILGIDPVQDTVFVPSSIKTASILLIQHETNSVVLMDFSRSTQTVFRMPFKVKGVHQILYDMWLIQSADLVIFRAKLVGAQLYLSKITATESIRKAKPALFLSQTDVDMTWLDLAPPDVYMASVSNLKVAMDTNKSIPIAAWIKPPTDSAKNFLNVQSIMTSLPKTQQIARVTPVDGDNITGWLDLIDPTKKRIRRISLPLFIPPSAVSPIQLKLTERLDQLLLTQLPAAKILETSLGHILIMDLKGTIFVYETAFETTMKTVKEWTKLTGSLDAGILKVIYEGEHPNGLVDGLDLESPAAIQGIGEGSSGGGSGSGGEGEGDGGEGGAGGTGKGGGVGEALPGDEGRQSGTIDVKNFQLRTVDELPKEITEAQREFHDKAMKGKLETLGMTADDMDKFKSYRTNIEREIRELHVILESVEAKNKERVWLKNRSSGEIDDTKLVEGIAGERLIYRVRGENDYEPNFQAKPKKLHFVFDLSASMMRFNGFDGRMTRTLECAIMLMESFRGFEHKFQYKISGHSGDGPDIVFVQEGKYPKNEKEIFMIVKKMSAHAAYCISGDNTILAVTTAIKNVTKEEADDYFVLVLSDANLHQYNISTETISAALNSDKRVNASMIFIGNVSDQASRLMQGLPGHAHVCLNNKELPKVMKTIFLNSMIK